MSAANFYMSEPREIELGLEGYRLQQEQEFHLQQIATSNAIGMYFQKGFKPDNPFKRKENKSGVSTSTKEEREETLSYLIEKFNNASG